MSQKLINDNLDYFNSLNNSETNHQNHRQTWTISTHALLFTGLCALSINHLKPFVEFLIIIIGISFSISSIYSVLVGELCNGVPYELWQRYNRLSLKRKNEPVAHRVSLVPKFILDSKWQFLMLYKFAPNLFCTGWIMLLLTYIEHHCDIIRINDWHFLYIIAYLFLLLTVCLLSQMITYRFRLELKNELDSNESQEKDNRKICPNFEEPCHSIYGEETRGGNFYNKHQNLSIYHIMIDRFCGDWTNNPQKGKDGFYGGNIRGIINKLDYIKSLGHNAIMLTPIFESKEYHGYHITDYDKIDYHFGDWGDFQELIHEAHKKRLKVICDYVPNHCHFDNPFFRAALDDKESAYRDWFYFDEGRKGNFISYQNYPGLPKFNLYNQAASDYLIAVALRLVKMGVDGIRIDHAIGVPFGFLSRLSQAVKTLNPNVFLFGEAWVMHPHDVSQIEFCNNSRKEAVMRDEYIQDDIQLDYMGIIDGVLDFSFRDLLIEEIQQGNRLLGNESLKRKIKAHFSAYPPYFTPILFVDNHDTNRFLFYCQKDNLLLQEAFALMRSLPYPMITYYGTEDYMCNDVDIIGRPNGDDDVRGPKIWK